MVSLSSKPIQRKNGSSVLGFHIIQPYSIKMQYLKSLSHVSRGTTVIFSISRKTDFFRIWQNVSWTKIYFWKYIFSIPKEDLDGLATAKASFGKIIQYHCKLFLHVLQYTWLMAYLSVFSVRCWYGEERKEKRTEQTSSQEMSN